MAKNACKKIRVLSPRSRQFDVLIQSNLRYFH
jgi:hypothetical protein